MHFQRPDRLRRLVRGPRNTRGFTLIELLVVLTLVGIVFSTVSLSLRDPSAAQLEQEANRLATLLETARAQARSSGLDVSWVPAAAASGHPSSQSFSFQGLPAQVHLPDQFLNPDVRVRIDGAQVIKLGPEPYIGAQRLTLVLGHKQLTLETDGLKAFSVATPETAHATK